MPTTYEPISSTTLGSQQASITFSPPNTYTDLRLVINAGHNSSLGFGTCLRFNGDTSSAYTSTVLQGIRSASSSFRYASQNIMIIGSSGRENVNNLIVCDIFNYNSPNVKQSILARSTSPELNLDWTIVGQWDNANAVTSITLFPETANFLVGSIFTLYGIKAA